MFLIDVRLKKYVVLENIGTLMFVSDCCNNQQMCGKAANSYLSTIKFVPECYKTQETCDKAVDTRSF